MKIIATPVVSSVLIANLETSLWSADCAPSPDETVQEGIVQHVDMEMQHVELGRERPHLFEHYDMMRDRILDAWVKP